MLINAQRKRGKTRAEIWVRGEEGRPVVGTRY